MINIKDKSQCCGCTACSSICPHNAISMKPDALGFVYPEVDETLCIDCGLCDKVCAFNENYDKSELLDEPIAYAARHKDIREVETSRSGAAFIALSDWILEHGGVVYGAGYKDHFRVAHKRAATKEQRNEFKGSKYVQSDVEGVFAQVKCDLKNGVKVLFSGTPCQVAGLKSFIGNRYRENLYLVDLVCHGVPGPFVWRDYLKYLESKEGKKITNVNFRNKQKFGWKAHRESFEFDNTYTCTYKYTFYQHIMFRYSCKVCPYTNLRRPSDITIADYWGWEKTDKEINKDNKGINLLICNTEKGFIWLNNISQNLLLLKAELENCLQPQLQHPVIFHPKREGFEESYSRYGFEKTFIKYALMGWKYELINSFFVKKISRLWHIIHH